MKQTRTIILCLLIVFTFTVWAEAKQLIIVNNSVTQSSLSKEDVQLIFLGKKKKWDNGQRIKVAVLKSGPVNEAFLDKYLNKTPSKYSSYWKIAIVSGTGRPPKSFDSEQELIDYVSKEKGAIGYISSQTPFTNVKAIPVK